MDTKDNLIIIGLAIVCILIWAVCIASAVMLGVLNRKWAPYEGPGKKTMNIVFSISLAVTALMIFGTSTRY